MLSENDSATLYPKDVQTYLRTRAWPRGLIIEIEEYEENLQFILFRDNFNAFDAADREQIAQQVRQVMEKIRSLGIPIYMEVKPGNGQQS